MVLHKYKTALFIGRFQPFHLGHLYSLKKCLDIAESVTIGIGSSQESGTPDNPWSYERRKKMVECVLVANDLQGRTLKVVPVPDVPSDSEWLAKTLKVSGEFEIVVSNNDWVLSIFRNAGYEVYESGLFNREELEGVKIRELLRKGDKGWEARVPECVVGLIGDPEVFG